jgi:hypothetical protein
MKSDSNSLAARIEHLERTTPRTRTLHAAAGIGLLATWITGAASLRTQRREDTIRTRLLVIEDAHGHDRIVLGAPMPDGRQYVGIKILNPDGAEQFGLGLKNAILSLTRRLP